MTKEYTPSNYLWKDFLSGVLAQMGLEGQRQGTGVDALRMGYIRAGVIILQTFIDQYRVNHENVYQPQDLVTEGRASRGVKPPQSVIRSVYTCSSCQEGCEGGTSKCLRWETEAWPWDSRFALVRGQVPVNNNMAKFCVDPQGYTFYVYPEIFDCWLLSIHWDGLKLDFNDLDETPFDELTVNAVAAYAKAQMKLEVEESVPLAAGLMEQFNMLKKACWLREREKSQAKG